MKSSASKELAEARQAASRIASGEPIDLVRQELEGRLGKRAAKRIVQAAEAIVRSAARGDIELDAGRAIVWLQDLAADETIHPAIRLAARRELNHILRIRERLQEREMERKVEAMLEGDDVWWWASRLYGRV